MKKLFIVLSLLLCGHLSQAQIDKGTVLLGGDITLSSTTGTGTSQNVKQQLFLVDPTVGLGVANNLVLGLDLGLGYQSERDAFGLQDNHYQAGVFLQKYKPLGSGFSFFGATELSFGYDDQTQDESAGMREDTRTTTVELAFSPGVAYALSHRWQMQVAFPRVLALSYSNQKQVLNIPEQGGPTQGETTEGYHSYGLSTSLSTEFQLSVGLQYLIGK